MKAQFTIAALAALLPFAALAQEKAVVARCGDDGCSCLLSSVTADEAAVVYGLDAPPKPDSVLVVPESGTPEWSVISADEVDLLYGGDGVCELQMFDEILPKDGMWKGTVKAEVIKGCPAAMVPSLKTATQAMANTRDIDWNGMFHPDKLRDPTAGERAFDWDRKAPGVWAGTGRFNRDSGPLGLEMQSLAMVQTPEHITATMTIAVGLDAADAQAKAILKASGLADCSVNAEYDFRLVK